MDFKATTPQVFLLRKSKHYTHLHFFLNVPEILTWQEFVLIFALLNYFLLLLFTFYFILLQNKKNTFIYFLTTNGLSNLPAPFKLITELFST